MIVMRRPEFFQYSCYKFSFLLGVIDMIVLPGNAIASGIQCMLGYHYCNNPSLFFIIGVIPTSGWYGACITCILLAFNRLFEVLAPRIADFLFGGKRIYIWLAMPILYIFFTFFQASAAYHIKYFAYYFVPFTGVEGSETAKHVNLTFHCIHNVCVVVLLGGIYSVLCFFLAMKNRLFKSANISKLQTLMTLQSMCICIEIFVAAIVYIYNQFLPLPDFLVIFAHASWICVHGDTPIVYLILNQSLRNAVVKLVRDFVKPAGHTTNSIGNIAMFNGGNTPQTNNDNLVNHNPVLSQNLNFENEQHPG